MKLLKGNFQNAFSWDFQKDGIAFYLKGKLFTVKLDSFGNLVETQVRLLHPINGFQPDLVCLGQNPDSIDPDVGIKQLDTVGTADRQHAAGMGF